MVYHAQCSYYQALLEAGVRIFLYPAPTILHSKHFSIDDDVAVIGSSNMDMRSFTLNYEISVMVTGEEGHRGAASARSRTATGATSAGSALLPGMAAAYRATCTTSTTRCG